MFILGGGAPVLDGQSPDSSVKTLRLSGGS